MLAQSTPLRQATLDGPTSWSAVYALALCSAALIASEFMPVSLLSPIAHDLGLTEGQAGQAISVSGVFAVLTSFFITTIAGRFNRRTVLILFSTLLIVSGTGVAAAPNFAVLMVARALLGIAIGGFWSMSTATIMRLVPAGSVGRGLAVIYGGNALASALAPPLGSFLGGLIGWRATFFSVVPLAAGVVAWQLAALPPMPHDGSRASANPLRLMKDTRVAIGLAAVGLLFMGQFGLFTYLRPFLEQVTRVDVSTLSVLLLVVGLSGFAGTSLIGRILPQGLHLALAATPAIMAICACMLVAFGTSVPCTAVLLAIWSLVATAAPVAWSTWLTTTMPNDAEAGGGLMVATIQLAITVGASLGGMVFDAAGGSTDFLASAGVLVLASVVALASGRCNHGLLVKRA